MPYLVIFRNADTLEGQPGDIVATLPSSERFAWEYPALLDLDWVAPSTRKRVKALRPGEQIRARVDARHVPAIEEAAAARHGL